MIKMLRDIAYVPTPRIRSGIDELDWIYGGDGKNWGFPKKMISLWFGPSGTGKSRSLITVARTMSSIGHRVAYFQNEVPLPEFRAWVGPGDLPPTFFASESTSLEQQIAEIRESRASLAVIDSVNQMEEFGGGYKAAIKHIYKRYKELTRETGTHIIFICQLDKDGQIKGGSELQFLSDILISLGHYYENGKKVDGYFTVSPGTKHRYGRLGAGFETLWKNDEFGAVCVSDNRKYDERWCKAHNLPVKKREVIPLGHMAGIIDPVSGSVFYPADSDYKKILFPRKKGLRVKKF